MLVDRSEVPAKYSVLSILPLPQAKEQLTWTTNIFIAADLSESRVALTQYPAITITYNFVLNSINRSFLESLITAKNEWVIPYLPHSTPAVVVGDDLLVGSVNGIYYPYYKYYLALTREAMVYRSISSPAGDGSAVALTEMIDPPYFDMVKQVTSYKLIAPCFVAQLMTQIQYTDLGRCMDGSTVSLVFRMSGESEKAMTYHQDNFDFVNSLQRPVQVQAMRHQSSFAPAPAPAHTYTPHARTREQIPKVTATYWLEYTDYNREDYVIRGYFMGGHGSRVSGHYIDDTKLHRIENDTLVINYDLRVAKATAMMREVAA